MFIQTNFFGDEVYVEKNEENATFVKQKAALWVQNSLESIKLRRLVSAFHLLSEETSPNYFRHKICPPTNSLQPQPFYRRNKYNLPQNNLFLHKHNIFNHRAISQQYSDIARKQRKLMLKIIYRKLQNRNIESKLFKSCQVSKTNIEKKEQIKNEEKKQKIKNLMKNIRKEKSQNKAVAVYIKKVQPNDFTGRKKQEKLEDQKNDYIEEIRKLKQEVSFLKQINEEITNKSKMKSSDKDNIYGNKEINMYSSIQNQLQMQNTRLERSSQKIYSSSKIISSEQYLSINDPQSQFNNSIQFENSNETEKQFANNTQIVTGFDDIVKKYLQNPLQSEEKELQKSKQTEVQIKPLLNSNFANINNFSYNIKENKEVENNWKKDFSCEEENYLKKDHQQRSIEENYQSKENCNPKEDQKQYVNEESFVFYLKKDQFNPKRESAFKNKSLCSPQEQDSSSNNLYLTHSQDFQEEENEEIQFSISNQQTNQLLKQDHLFYQESHIDQKFNFDETNQGFTDPQVLKHLGIKFETVYTSNTFKSFDSQIQNSPPHPEHKQINKTSHIINSIFIESQKTVKSIQEYSREEKRKQSIIDGIYIYRDSSKKKKVTFAEPHEVEENSYAKKLTISQFYQQPEIE